MNSCNFYVDREEAEFINDEIEFVSGKTGLPEERAIELIKINLLSNILCHLEEQERRKTNG